MNTWTCSVSRDDNKATARICSLAAPLERILAGLGPAWVLTSRGICCTVPQIILVSAPARRAGTYISARDSRNGNYGILASRRGPLWLALFEPLCFQNGLDSGRGKERDQRSCGVSLIAASNDARGELGVVLNR